MLPAWCSRLGLNDSKRSTRGQLARGAVAGQVARITNLTKRPVCRRRLVGEVKIRTLKKRRMRDSAAGFEFYTKWHYVVREWLRLKLALKPDPCKTKGPAPRVQLQHLRQRVVHPPIKRAFQIKGFGTRHPNSFSRGNLWATRHPESNTFVKGWSTRQVSRVRRRSSVWRGSGPTKKEAWFRDNWSSSDCR
jgi:hypothetical protein